MDHLFLEIFKLSSFNDQKSYLCSDEQDGDDDDDDLISYRRKTKLKGWIMMKKTLKKEEID